MRCESCGASYPAASYCPQCGAGPARVPEFLPLVGLADALAILLGLVLAVIATTLGLRLLGATNLQVHGTVVAQWLDTAGDLIVFVFAVLFVGWFRRARINAERHGYRQRRARGWTFWGWLVPIVDLWFPFQLMGDIWRAGLPADRRGKTAWLPALWWTCWLLSGLSLGMSKSAANAGTVPHLGEATSSASLCCLALSGAALITIIRRVSGGPVGSPLASDDWAQTEGHPPP